MAAGEIVWGPSGPLRAMGCDSTLVEVAETGSGIDRLPVTAPGRWFWWYATHTGTRGRHNWSSGC